MVKKVIINADDFGMSLGTTIGILHAHEEGIVTSATCMMNMPYATIALTEAKKFPRLGVGIHLTLTVGRPLLEGAKSYVDENGDFRKQGSYPNHHVVGDENEVYHEWKAQIEKFIDIAGKKPTHIDAHHHVHLLPEQLDVVKKLAKEYDVPIRQREQVMDLYEYVPFVEDMYGFDNINIENVKRIMCKDQEMIEIMCHPALIDQKLYESTSYSMERMKELDLLCNPILKQWLEKQQIQLINYSDLRRL